MKLVCFGFLVVLGYLFGTIVMALEGARAVLSTLFNFPDAADSTPMREVGEPKPE